MRCDHVKARPVTVGGETVAHLCPDCDTQLERGWDCDQCDWQEIEEPRRLCEAATTTTWVRVRVCPAHV